MPRKPVLKPATPRQVIEFYKTASKETIETVADIASGIVEERFAKTGETKSKPGPKPRAAAKAAAAVSEPAGD